MKKRVSALLAGALFALLTGCGSTKNVATAPAAPDWVLNGAKASDAQYWYAVGEAKMPTEQNSLKMARMQARAELARTINTQVKELVSANEKINNAGEKTQELTQSLQVSTEALLQGSEQAGRFTAPDGTVYVLMSLPKAQAVQKINETVATVTGKSETFVTVDDFNK